MTTEMKTPESGNPVRPEIPERSKISNGTIINVVLFVGLIVLYVLNIFPLKDSETTAGNEIEQEMDEMASLMEQGAFNIAFVNSDTLMANYKLALDKREEFEQEQRRLENDLQRRQRSFQTEVETFQQQIQTGNISLEDAQAREQQLMQRQQELMQLNEDYSSRLMTKELEINIDLYQRITELLSRFNEEMGYDYILGFSPGGDILYAKEKHDITQKVLNKLNEEYDVQ